MQQIKADTASSEYALAFSSVRRAKNIFLLLVILALLVQLGAAGVVRFSKLLDPLYARKTVATATSATATTSPASSPASAPADAAKKLQIARTLDTVLGHAMHLSKFLGMVACMLLVFMLLLAVKLSLLDRLGGIAGLMSALLWSIFLFPMLLPWQQIVTGGFAYGALCNYAHILEASTRINPAWGGSAADLTIQITYFARFFAYPGLALMICLLVQSRFACGFKRISAFHSAPMPL